MSEIMSMHWGKNGSSFPWWNINTFEKELEAGSEIIINLTD